MTEQITLNLTLEELKLIDKYVELNNDTQKFFDKVKSAYPQPKMTLENEGEFDIVSYDGYVYYRLKYPTDVIWYNKSMTGRLEPIKDTKTKNELESQWLMNDVKYQNDDEPYCPDDPEWSDEVECDEKDNPNLEKIIDKMVEERKAQKLWNRVRDELGYSVDLCDEIVDLVEDWMPKEQSSSGSQNVNTELLVEGFNDAIREMKEMLS